MLRITRLTGTDRPTTLRIEGKLVGPWVAELRDACPAGEPVRLELSAVSFADTEGIELLRALLAGGATLGACSGMVAELLRREAP